MYEQHHEAILKGSQIDFDYLSWLKLNFDSIISKKSIDFTTI